MYLLDALEVASVAGVDPNRPLRLGPFELGIDATTEAIRILSGGPFEREVSRRPCAIPEQMYWSIAHRTEGNAEVFGFPMGVTTGLKTAIEIALVRAIAASVPQDHGPILSGGEEIALGSPRVFNAFREVLAIVDRPLVGTSLLFQQATQAIVSENASIRLNRVTLSCLANNFRTSPLKFRFLELYRVMEALFLADIKGKLLASFDAEPNEALSDASEALKSEMNQIIGLAATEQVAFESCWIILEQLKNTNRFAAALFRRLQKKGPGGGDKWRAGAALIYYIRCAIVHAGEKDLIFENFPDGGDVIDAVIPDVERAALLLIGIDVS